MHIPLYSSCSWINVAYLVLLGGGEADLVPEQVPDVVDPVVDHRRSFQTESPGDHAHVFRQAHGPQHLRAENPGVSDFYPALELGVVTEDFHGGFGVGVEGGLELELLDADLGVEGLQDADQVTQAYVAVGDEAFALVEFRQVGRVQGLVSEYSVNGEILHGFEFRLQSKLVQHLRADSSSVSSQQILLGFLHVPVVLVPEGAVAAFLVDFLDALSELLREVLARDGVLQEEGVVHVSGGVALRLEQGVEVPEGALHVPVGGHLVEAHLQEYLAEVVSHL